MQPPREISAISDSLNLQYDRLAILFIPHVDEHSDDEFAPFYVILNIHNVVLHNSMLYSATSQNLMPRRIMDQLGLDMTRPYKDIFSFDSNKFKCLGLIKDLVIFLTQIMDKTLVMDMVVVDIPPKFRMLLSRAWEAKIKGALYMDMSYATIPIFGIQRRLFRVKNWPIWQPVLKGHKTTLYTCWT